MLSVPGGGTPRLLTSSVLRHYSAELFAFGLYPADGPSLQQLVADVDDALFARIQANQHHVLQELLPPRTCHKYGLRSRRHNYTLNIKTDYDDRNFITRLLHKDTY